jgi:hypothetical protein
MSCVTSGRALAALLASLLCAGPVLCTGTPAFAGSRELGASRVDTHHP